MPSPSDSKKIVLVNSLYPDGLTTGMVYEYYQENKERILKEIDNRPIITFMGFESYIPLVVRRNIKGELIRLNSSNYDDVISGYTISLSSETPDPTDYVVIDVDPKSGTTDKYMEVHVLNPIINILGKMHLGHAIHKFRVTTSAKGFHLYVDLAKVVDINFAREMIIEELSRIKPFFPFDINDKNGSMPVNLDLSPMYKRGSVTVPWALIRDGSICKDVTKKYENFNRKLNHI